MYRLNIYRFCSSRVSPPTPPDNQLKKPCLTILFNQITMNMSRKTNEYLLFLSIIIFYLLSPS